MAEKIVNNGFSPELLDALSGVLLQLSEEMDNPDFSNVVVTLLQAFDGETFINAEMETDIQIVLSRFRNKLGLNTYCLLKGILFHHRNEPDKLQDWFRMIALNTFTGREYWIYQLLNDSMN
jgi:hypothetical protein